MFNTIMLTSMSNLLVLLKNRIFLYSDGGRYYLDLKNGAGDLGHGDAKTDIDVTMTLKADNFVKMARGEINPTTAFMTGKLKIDGNLGIATKLEKVLKQVQSKL